MRALHGAGFRGANVTIPHKEAALALATTRSDGAREIGAANTLTFAAGGEIAAENTDAPGLIAALGDRPLRSALVLGAGGSARAVVWALRGAGADVSIWNRTAARAEGLGARVVRDAIAGRYRRQLHERRARPYVQSLQGSAPGRRCPAHLRNRRGPGLRGRGNS